MWLSRRRRISFAVRLWKTWIDAGHFERANEMNAKPSGSHSGRGGPDSVALALDLLLEEIDGASHSVRRVGADAFGSGDDGTVEASLARSRILKEFYAKVVALRTEWRTLASSVGRAESGKSSFARRNLGRLRNGLRTPESEFVQPILQVLNEMGGRGRTADVVARVGHIMKPVLRDPDYERLESSHEPRWIKTANWTRRRMVIEGLLRRDSQRGIWEISDEGRAHLLS